MAKATDNMEKHSSQFKNRITLLGSTLLALSATLSAQFAPATGSPFALQGASSVAVGDFNGDAIPDVAIVGPGSATGFLSVLTSNGSAGSFAPARQYLIETPPGTPPGGVVAADFFGDGILSLAIANSSGNQVFLMRGGSDAYFHEYSIFDTGKSPVSMATGDFNGDGKTDLAVANGGDNSVNVFFGDGMGGGIGEKTLSAGISPASIAAADFNHDGHLDLVIVNNGGSGGVSVFLGDGSGNFTQPAGSPFAAGISPNSAGIADFNGDGNPDLAVANSGSGNVTLLLGDGAGGFRPAASSPFAAGATPSSLAVADFNSDGAMDLAVANSLDGTVSVLLGNGLGGFVAAPGSPFISGTDPLSIAAADFNGDGMPDLAIANLGSSSLTILLNTFPEPSGPAITNIQNGATYATESASSSYVAIFGRNLSTTTPGRGWTQGDFTSNPDGTLSMPTSLDGTSVTIDGVPAYISYVSAGQLNVITPPNVSGPNIPVTVTVRGRTSAVFPLTIENVRPSFFAWQPDTLDSGRYLIAQHADYTNVGKVGLFPGAPANFTTPAKPGETIILYGTGFGPTSPPIASGIETDKIYRLAPSPFAMFGSLPATIAFAGLVPPLSQVYQINLTVPPGTPNGDQPVTITVNGATGEQSYTGYITVQQ